MSKHVNNHFSQASEEEESDEVPSVVFLPLINWDDHERYSSTTQNEYITNLPQIPYSGKISSKGRAFKFSDPTCQSTASKLHEGDILFCEQMDYRSQSLVPLQLYVVVMKDEFLCRRFFREDRHYEFRSDNPEGCHLIVSTNLILEIWEVKSILKTAIPAPRALRNELQVNEYKFSTT